VFFEIRGRFSTQKTPVLLLHGGPGFSHELQLGLEQADPERGWVFYTQLGSGRSDRPQDLSLWTMDRFIREIDCVRDALGLDQIVLWGGSWGTMLGVDYLLKGVTGVQAAILSGPCLSVARWKADADRLRGALPPEVRDDLIRHERAGTTSSDEYQRAELEYLKRHVIRLDPLPEKVLEASRASNRDIYEFLWGPSEFHPTGILKDYERTDRLHELRMPVLIVCGEHDEATPESSRHYASLIPGARFEVVPGAAHLSFVEQPDAYIQIISRFLAQLS